MYREFESPPLRHFSEISCRSDLIRLALFARSTFPRGEGKTTVSLLLWRSWREATDEVPSRRVGILGTGFGPGNVGHHVVAIGVLLQQVRNDATAAEDDDTVNEVEDLTHIM